MQYPPKVLSAMEALTNPQHDLLHFRAEGRGRGVSNTLVLSAAQALSEGLRVHISAGDSVSIVRSTLRAMGVSTDRLVVTYY